MGRRQAGECVYKADGKFQCIQPDELDAFPEDGWEEYVITPEAPFDSSFIPGVEDGVYPPWLSSGADALLPEKFQEMVGETLSSHVAGAWIEYPCGKLEAMMKWLNQKAYSVTAHLSYGAAKADSA